MALKTTGLKTVDQLRIITQQKYTPCCIHIRYDCKRIEKVQKKKNTPIKRQTMYRSRRTGKYDNNKQQCPLNSMSGWFGWCSLNGEIFHALNSACGNESIKLKSH